MALRFANFEPSLTVVRIDPPDRIDVDLNSVEFVVTFGGAKDDGNRHRCEGERLPALHARLDKLSLSAPAIDTATQVLAVQPSHTIQDVTLTRKVLRSLGSDDDPECPDVPSRSELNHGPYSTGLAGQHPETKASELSNSFTISEVDNRGSV